MHRGYLKIFHNNEENYNYALSTSEAIWGWDEDKLVLLIATNYSSRKNLEDTIETIMELDEEDQISENEEFVNFHKNKKDISLWVSSNLMKSSEFAGMYDEITKEKFGSINKMAKLVAS